MLAECGRSKPDELTTDENSSTYTIVHGQYLVTNGNHDVISNLCISCFYRRFYEKRKKSLVSTV